MSNILILFLFYKFIFINILAQNISQNKSHFIKKRIRKIEYDYSEEIYDNSTDEINEIEINTIPIFNVTNNLILQNTNKPEYLFLLIGFDSYERRGKYISWFIYFRVSDIVLPLKVLFNVSIYFNSMEDEMNRIITCNFNKESRYLNLKYYCSFILDENNEYKEIKQIKIDYDSFLFDNLSYEIILSPNAKYSINDIQKQNYKLYEKFIKDDKNDLYILDDGKLKIDNKKQKLYISYAKINNNNEFLNNNNKTVEGNFIFKFKNELSGYSEINIPCNISIYKDCLHTLECNLKGPILTNINKAIGYGNEENIKSKFVMLNINDNLLNYTGYNEINNYEYIKKKNFTGLSGWTVGGIIIVFFVFCLLMSISFMILNSNKKSKKRKKKLLIVS